MKSITCLSNKKSFFLPVLFFVCLMSDTFAAQLIGERGQRGQLQGTSNYVVENTFLNFDGHENMVIDHDTDKEIRENNENNNSQDIDEEF